MVGTLRCDVRAGMFVAWVAIPNVPTHDSRECGTRERTDRKRV
jgi:hypothetical protein